MEETDKTDKKSKETEQVKSGEPVQKPAARTARRNNYYAYATPGRQKTGSGRLVFLPVTFLFFQYELFGIWKSGSIE